jgi:hypothetical protein
LASWPMWFDFMEFARFAMSSSTGIDIVTGEGEDGGRERALSSENTRCS